MDIKLALNKFIEAQLESTFGSAFVGEEASMGPPDIRSLEETATAGDEYR